MADRKAILNALETERGSRILCYVTSDRRGQEAQIGEDVLPCIATHLQAIERCSKLDLLIYSRGGNTLTGFALANAMREFSDTVSVLVPFRAHSCATLIALGAEAIVMGPLAQLSPIDPSIQTPHGPVIQDRDGLKFLPVSVEDVANYFELARKEASLASPDHMATVLGHLCQRVSPLALGAVYRAREQIGMLATKLMNLHTTDTERVAQVVKTLTRELLTHDYIINRREAKTIGLNAVDAGDKESQLMWQLYESFADEMKLSEPWVVQSEVNRSQPVKVSRAIVESTAKKHIFESTYNIKKSTVTQDGQKVEAIQVTALGESWREE